MTAIEAPQSTVSFRQTQDGTQQDDDLLLRPEYFEPMVHEVHARTPFDPATGWL